MKKLFITILILTQLSAFAQDSTTTQITETERIVDKYVDQATEAMKGLATALEVPAEHVYDILVWQQLATGIATFIIWGILVIALIIMINSAIKAWKNHHKEAKESGDRYFDLGDSSSGVIALILTIVSAFLGIIMLVFIPIEFSEAIVKILNPEYGAIKEIMDLIKRQ